MLYLGAFITHSFSRLNEANSYVLIVKQTGQPPYVCEFNKCNFLYVITLKK